VRGVSQRNVQENHTVTSRHSVSAGSAEVRRLPFFAYALALLALAAGCQVLAGDFTIAETTFCEQGDVQCVGNVLQTCNQERDGWDNSAVCASEALCDGNAGVCRTPECAPGERRCLEAELQLCNGTRDGWLRLDTCASAGHCSTMVGGCMDVPCAPGEIQCSGAVLQSCNDDQSGWSEIATCASAALCNEIDGVCDDGCAAGTFRCHGEQLQACSLTLDSWTTVRVCESDDLCDAIAGNCREGGCSSPGAFRCSDTGVLERCEDNLTAWKLLDACASAAHCDAVAGKCMEEPCTAGEYQCNGAKLEVCNAERTGRDPVATCDSEGLCQLTLEQGSTTCEPPRCMAGEYHCEGAQPQICNAGFTGYRNNGTACSTPELCNEETGTCEPEACGPGQTTCVGAQPMECNPGQTGYVPKGSPCASVALCNSETGTCGDVACVAGQVRCDPLAPTHFQRCNAMLNGWDDCDTCASDRLCSVSLATATTCGETSCQEPTCALTDIWCGGTDNRGLYKCPASRINTEAELLDVCATAGLCQQTHSQGKQVCNAPTCALTDLWCGGTGERSLYKCPPSRINSQAEVLDTCETKGLCVETHAAGLTSCVGPKCGVAQMQCGGTGNTALRQCNSERTGYMDCDTCDTAALCTASLTQTTCNASACRVCVAGQKRCSGSQLQVCNTNRDGWTNLQLCGSSALCMNSLTPASQMTCDACVAGNYRCAEAQPQICDDPGTGATAWAANGMECDAAALCAPAEGACICSLEDTRCNPDSGNFESCEATGWTETAICETDCDDETGCL
jgi:hypothetical protein